MPEELHESVEAVAEYLGPMTEEEVNKTMEMIRTMSQQIVDQMDRETLWRYMTTIRLKSIFEEQAPKHLLNILNMKQIISWSNMKKGWS